MAASDESNAGAAVFSLRAFATVAADQTDGNQGEVEVE